MLSGSNRIYGRHMIIYNGQFAECEVLVNFQGLYGPRTRTRKLVLQDPRGQGLSSWTTTLHISIKFQLSTASHRLTHATSNVCTKFKLSVTYATSHFVSQLHVVRGTLPPYTIFSGFLLEL